MQLYDSFCWLIFICFYPPFQGARINKIIVEGICLLTVVAMEIGRIQSFIDHMNNCKENKIFYQKHECLIYLNYHL